MLKLWTDGSASPNPGPGGYAVLQQISSKEAKPVRLGRAKNTTNNRMEGFAIIAALKYANKRPCEIYTDSNLWVKTLTEWAENWERKGWLKSNNKPVENLDIVKKAYKLYQESNAEIFWIKGHAGTKFNELTDYWANQARESLKTDTVPGYDLKINDADFNAKQDPQGDQK